jgi:hypothetical protein
VNRFGILCEALIEGSGDALRFAFAGLITQSPEQDLEPARRSFRRGSADGLNVVIAAGESKNGVLSCSTGSVRIPSEPNWTDVAAKLPG